MNLGAFSSSLSVNDLTKSKEFYEALGFVVFAGSMEKNYLIMKNGSSVIGLFQGMFDQNILTFNPGWDQEAQSLSEFQDVRSIQAELKKKGLEFIKEADESTEGPENCILLDPDGNTIFFDQHV